MDVALVKSLAEEQDKIKKALSDLAASKLKEAREDPDNKDAKYILASSYYSNDEKEQHDRLIAEHDYLESTIKAARMRLDEKRVEDERDDVYGKNDGYTEARIKANVKAYKDIQRVIRKQYLAKDASTLDSPRQLAFAAPLISRNECGENIVHSFPAIFPDTKGINEDDYEDKKLEASFRYAEMIKGGVQTKYDPVTGNRIEADFPADYWPWTADQLQDQIGDVDLAGALPDIATNLYRYMITDHDLYKYMDIRQYNTLAQVNMVRRLTIPEATVIGNRSNFGQMQGIPAKRVTFDTISLGALKYAFIEPFTWESTTSLVGMNMMNELAEAGGRALANGFGRGVITGDGGATKPQGIHWKVKNTASQQIAGVAFANAFKGTKLFGAEEMIRFLMSFDEAYYKSGSKRIICNLKTWSQLVSVTDEDGNTIFLNTQGSGIPMSILDFPVALESLVPSATAAGDIPFMIADLKGHLVRFTFGPRIDYSDQVGWEDDTLALRFIQYADAIQKDPNTVKGYKLA